MKICLAGVGAFAKKHLDALARIEGVTVVEPRRARRAALNRKWMVGQESLDVTTVSSIAELASIVNLQENYFTNLFTKDINISPGRYVNNRKIERDKQLLKSPST